MARQFKLSPIVMTLLLLAPALMADDPCAGIPEALQSWSATFPYVADVHYQINAIDGHRTTITIFDHNAAVFWKDLSSSDKFLFAREISVTRSQHRLAALFVNFAHAGPQSFYCSYLLIPSKAGTQQYQFPQVNSTPNDFMREAALSTWWNQHGADLVFSSTPSESVASTPHDNSSPSRTNFFPAVLACGITLFIFYLVSKRRPRAANAAIPHNIVPDDLEFKVFRPNPKSRLNLEKDDPLGVFDDD
jgi:hypothetical protein